MLDTEGLSSRSEFSRPRCLSKDFSKSIPMVDDAAPKKGMEKLLLGNMARAFPRQFSACLAVPVLSKALFAEAIEMEEVKEMEFPKSGAPNIDPPKKRIPHTRTPAMQGPPLERRRSGDAGPRGGFEEAGPRRHGRPWPEPGVHDDEAAGQGISHGPLV